MLPHAVAALLAREPRTLGELEQAFGPLEMDGSWPQRVARGPTWLCTMRPIEGELPEEVQLELEPALAAEPLVAALGWTDAIIRTTTVDMTMPVLRRRSSTGEDSDERVCFHVVDEGLAPGRTSVPAGRTYEVRGARVRLACWTARRPG